MTDRYAPFAALTPLLAAVNAFAQTPAAATDGANVSGVEEIVVTGTRIQGCLQLPVVVLQ